MAVGKHSFSWFWSFRLTALDIVSLLISYAIASAIDGHDIFSSNLTLEEGLLVIASFMVCMIIIGGYDTTRDMSKLTYASEHVLAMCIVLAVAFIATYGFSSYHESVKPGRALIVLTLLIATPLSFSYRYYFSSREARTAAARAFYVIGKPELTQYLQAICKQAKFRYPLRFSDVAVETGLPIDIQESDLIHATAGDLMKKIQANEINQFAGVIIDLSNEEALDEEAANLLLSLNLHSVPVYPVNSFIETYLCKVDLSQLSLVSALDGTFKGDHQMTWGKLKSLIDVFLAALCLLVLSPLILVIAIMIKMQDFGPVFFTQERVGRFEQPFLIYKFRTMRVRDEHDSQYYTETGDSRITRFGRLLRLMRLDELPQLWNVVKGEMSIIGPRAEWSKLAERYEEEIPFYHLRHMVKPGITGWAQVNYGYGASSDDAVEKLQYDLYYIKYFSPHMDASIVLKTIFTMLSASGR